MAARVGRSPLEIKVEPTRMGDKTLFVRHQMRTNGTVLIVAALALSSCRPTSTALESVQQGSPTSRPTAGSGSLSSRQQAEVMMAKIHPGMTLQQILEYG